MTYGVRARLAWHWRRVQGKPWRITSVDAAGSSFYAAVLDEKPPWRKPRPGSWSGWQDIGCITDRPPEAFRRRT
jgi:hypothetical protein